MSSGEWRSFCLGLNVLRILSDDGLASIDVRMFASSLMTDSVPVIMTFDILVGIRNHSPSKIWNEITYPYPGFNRSTIQVGDGYIISSNTLVWIYLSMLSLSYISVSSRGPSMMFAISFQHQNCICYELHGDQKLKSNSAMINHMNWGSKYGQTLHLRHQKM